MRIAPWFFAIGLALKTSSVAAGTAEAGMTNPVLPATIRRLMDCAELQPDAARLACYDREARELRASLKAGQTVALDQEQMRQIDRQAFGLTLPSLSFLSGRNSTGQNDILTAKVERAQRGPDGKWVVQLQGGGTWRQIDLGDLSPEPRPGLLATVRRAAFGSFMMSVGGHSAIRVHRSE